jgi:hypothetical protein
MGVPHITQRSLVMTVIRTKAALVANYRTQLAENISDGIDGLITVFNNQRSDEVATNSTYHHNRIGFNKSDAKVLTQIAKDKLDGKDLNDIQAAEVSRRMPKYAWQIITNKISSGQYVKQSGVYVKV